jgi:hypothetical protein
MVSSSGIGMLTYVSEESLITNSLAGLAMAKNAVGSFVSTLMPNRGLMAVANVEIDLDDVPEGKSITFDWRGKPLFVRHREQWEIDEGILFVFFLSVLFYFFSFYPYMFLLDSLLTC